MENFQIPKAKQQVIPEAENLFKSALLLGLLVGSFALAQYGVIKIDASEASSSFALHTFTKWGFVFALSLFNCVLLTGIGVIAHEGIHGVLFRNKFLNELCGGILSGLTVFLPFYANRDFHLKTNNLI